MSSTEPTPLDISHALAHADAINQYIRNAPSDGLQLLESLIRDELGRRDASKAPPMTDEEFELDKFKAVKAYRDRTGLLLRVCLQVWEKKKESMGR